MLIDSCASGGRRNDLETLRRAVPLLRSDDHGEPTSEQCHTYGIASWMPYYGTGSGAFDAYTVRSNFCPHLTIGYDMRDRKLDYPAARRLTEEWRHLAPYFFGDYYPLTPYSFDRNAWIAWQFDRPESSDGLVQAFRRPDARDETIRVKLHGLDRDAMYEITDLDSPGAREAKGRALEDEGLTIASKASPGAVMITYKKKT